VVDRSRTANEEEEKKSKKLKGESGKEAVRVWCLESNKRVGPTRFEVPYGLGVLDLLFSVESQGGGTFFFNFFSMY
jgi:hypothetical protein